MKTRNVRTSFGKRQPMYVQVGGVTQGSARDAATLAALIARVSARRPSAALVVIEFGKNGERTERAVELTALAA